MRKVVLFQRQPVNRLPIMLVFVVTTAIGLNSSVHGQQFNEEGYLIVEDRYPMTLYPRACWCDKMYFGLAIRFLGL